MVRWFYLEAPHHHHRNHTCCFLKHQYTKLAKTEVLLKNLYCENGTMMKALQLTEARQKHAEQKWKDELERKAILANLLQNVTPQVA